MKDYPPYFKAVELRCKCGQCDGGEMDDSFMAIQNLIREECGFPLVVNSAFRCEAHNAAVGGVVKSDHTRGLAIDYSVTNPQALTLVAKALKYVVRIGVSQIESKPRFIHVSGDTSPVAIWSY